MSKATVVNIHHGTQYDVYIGRRGRGMQGPIGNPIAIGKTCPVCSEVHGRDERLLQCYRRWLWRRIKSDDAYGHPVASLHGKRLGCFCVRQDGSGLCHGHVLADAAAWLALSNVETQKS